MVQNTIIAQHYRYIIMHKIVPIGVLIYFLSILRNLTSLYRCSIYALTHPTFKYFQESVDDVIFIDCIAGIHRWPDFSTKFRQKKLMPCSMVGHRTPRWVCIFSIWHLYLVSETRSTCVIWWNCRYIRFFSWRGIQNVWKLDLSDSLNWESLPQAAVGIGRYQRSDSVFRCGNSVEGHAGSRYGDGEARHLSLYHYITSIVLRFSFLSFWSSLTTPMWWDDRPFSEGASTCNSNR